MAKGAAAPVRVIRRGVTLGVSLVCDHTSGEGFSSDFVPVDKMVGKWEDLDDRPRAVTLVVGVAPIVAAAIFIAAL